MAMDLERTADHPLVLSETERLQLLEGFGAGDMLYPEHMNAIIGELLSLRRRVAQLEGVGQ